MQLSTVVTRQATVAAYNDVYTAICFIALAALAMLLGHLLLNTLRAWMADNQDFLPGTRMRHVSIHDKAEQDFLLAYINSLSKK